jgi:hypothetical protein
VVSFPRVPTKTLCATLPIHATRATHLILDHLVRKTEYRRDRKLCRRKTYQHVVTARSLLTDTPIPSVGFEPDTPTKRHTYRHNATHERDCAVDHNKGSRWWHVIMWMVKVIIYFLLPDWVQSPWCNMATSFVAFT